MVFVFAGMMENMFVFFHIETAKGVKPHTVSANGLMQMKENKQTNTTSVEPTCQLVQHSFRTEKNTTHSWSQRFPALIRDKCVWKTNGSSVVEVWR